MDASCLQTCKVQRECSQLNRAADTACFFASSPAVHKSGLVLDTAAFFSKHVIHKLNTVFVLTETCFNSMLACSVEALPIVSG